MNSPRLSLKQMLVKKTDGGAEAVQYWIVMGGKVVTNDFENRLRHFYISLIGAKSDGVLVRVSSLSLNSDANNDYKVQDEFTLSLYKILTPETRYLLFGITGAT